MAYKNKNGITKLKSCNIDNLSISYDSDHNNDDVRFHYPVFLFTPDMENKTEHYHIPLDFQQTKKLHAWLSEFIKEKGNAIRKYRNNRSK